MEIILIPVFLICLLYLVFSSAQKKRSPFLTLLWIAFFVGITMGASFLLAAVITSYHGQKEWAQEKQFFFHTLAGKLESSGDLKTTAKYMQSAEVKERTLIRIQEIVDSFQPKTILFLTFGGFVLVLTAVSLWIKAISGKKYYPYLLPFFVLIGGILLDMGVYYRQYASGTDKHLRNFLRCQQDMMKELYELKTDRSIPEMVKIIRKEAVKPRYGYGGNLPNLLKTKGKKRKSSSEKP